MRVLRFIWQLPQNLIALFLILISLDRKKKEYTCFDGTKVKVWFVSSVFGCGVSLGDFILLDKASYLGQPNRVIAPTVNHEHGHQKQSLYFGWFYLLLVGLPSAFNNIWDRTQHKRWSYAKRNRWYYSRYPEKWADKLGFVVREQ